MRIKDVVRTNEALQENFEKVKKANEKLNAIVNMSDLDKEINESNQDENSVLYKVPVILKDNITTKGLLTTASTKILTNYVPVYDATVTKKLKEAGAVITAKASMDELGMGGTGLNAYTGAVINPYDENKITGGSSSGSAAVVSANLTPISIGTDTGDSIRRPAAYTGCIGVKPTYGRISRYGVIPYASSLDTVGYMTTSVEDAATVLEVIAGRDDNDMTSSYKEVEKYSSNLNGDLNGKKIAVLTNVLIEDAKVKEVFDSLIENIKAKGAIVEEVTLEEKYMRALLPTYLTISNAEATANHANLDGIRFGVREEGDDLTEIMTNSRTEGLSSYVKKRFVIGAYSLDLENQEKLFRKAQKVRRLICNELKAKMEDYDCILSMTSVNVAVDKDKTHSVDIDDATSSAANHMLLANFSGYPAMSMPCGFKDELPLGVHIMCKPFAEQMMFDIAKGIEEITGLEGTVKEVI